MDQHSILDHNSASPAVEGETPVTGASRSAPASVTAGIAAASAHPAHSAEAEPRFPGQNGGRSLAEMAHRDLDAALQLLAERAQYITGASGAAIALRRGEHNDMLCRASAGSNAPEVGALLSMEYGLSGESVRTRQTLRCDDAENDPRVNREGCRQLGIASVVVMPIVSEQQVLGVFELFSGQPRAFEPRDISALQRLAEMVETAVKHAVAAQSVPVVEETDGVQVHLPVDETAVVATPESPVSVRGVNSAPTPPHDFPPNTPTPPEPVKTVAAGSEEAKVEPLPKLERLPGSEPLPKKPLFWSAALPTQPSVAGTDKTAASVAVPPVLRNLQKCQACGFPVSHGRTLCVECEEKQWRGQRLPAEGGKPADAKGAGPTSPVARTLEVTTSTPVPSATLSPQPSGPSSSETGAVRADLPVSDNSTLFLSSATSSESWFAANKYTLGALLVVAIIVAAIVWLR